MKNRTNKFFRKDKKTFILAMDHGTSLNVLPDLQDPGRIIDIAVENGVDGIICSYGIYERYASHFGSVPAMIRADGGASALGDGTSKTLGLLSVKDILRLGGDALVCMGFPGASYERESIESLQHYIAEGQKWNFPICAEVLPGGWDNAAWTPDNLTFVSRIGAELGADIIKTQYTGDKESFKKLVDSVFVPVVILGGPGTGSPKDLLKAVADSIEMGGSGVAIGRSIWKHPRPAAYCQAIGGLVHGTLSLEQACALMEV